MCGFWPCRYQELSTIWVGADHIHIITANDFENRPHSRARNGSNALNLLQPSGELLGVFHCYTGRCFIVIAEAAANGDVGVPSRHCLPERSQSNPFYCRSK